MNWCPIDWARVDAGDVLDVGGSSHGGGAVPIPRRSPGLRDTGVRFETDEKDLPKTFPKEKMDQIAADFMTELLFDRLRLFGYGF